MHFGLNSHKDSGASSDSTNNNTDSVVRTPNPEIPISVVRLGVTRRGRVAGRGKIREFLPASQKTQYGALELRKSWLWRLSPAPIRCSFDIDGKDFEGNGGSDPVQPPAPDVFVPCHPVDLLRGGLGSWTDFVTLFEILAFLFLLALRGGNGLQLILEPVVAVLDELDQADALKPAEGACFLGKDRFALLFPFALILRHGAGQRTMTLKTGEDLFSVVADFEIAQLDFVHVGCFAQGLGGGELHPALPACHDVLSAAATGIGKELFRFGPGLGARTP